MQFRSPFQRKTLREDAVAGLVLGVQSVPDGLATGLLAGVNPLAGLYGYLVGTIAGAAATSSAFMAIQGTGAMAMIVADVPAIHGARDPAVALFTLSVLTGLVMLAAGLFHLGSVLRFVSNAVMVGFINAVGVNIILGQLSNFTGYSAPGPNRIIRALQTVVNPSEIHLATLAIGVATIVLILVLERTRLGAMGLVLAVVVTSAAALVFGWHDVATLNDLGEVPRSLPTPTLPSLILVPSLIVPALSLAFVGLVQGASISTNYPNSDGSFADTSRDFVGQGVANVASGIFQGMPVGGSVSASALNKAAGAKSRQALFIASLVMALVILIFATAIGYVAMPALAGLLMLIGFRTIKPDRIATVWKTGIVQKAVFVVTFILTMLIPLQYAVLVGVGVSVILHIVRQSNQVSIKRRLANVEGDLVETDPPAAVPPGEVVVLQPYGSLFFAAAPVFEAQLPAVQDSSSGSVVILRLRGRSDLGTTFMDVLLRYAHALDQVGSRLMIASTNVDIEEQLAVTGITAVIGQDSVYRGDERVGATTRQAESDAQAWVESHRQHGVDGS